MPRGATKQTKTKFSWIVREMQSYFLKGGPLGGGSAGAVSGLLAIGLLRKVIGYSQLESEKAVELNGGLQTAGKKLDELAWADGEVFKAYLAEKTEASQLKICEIPLAIAGVQLDLMKIATWLADHGSKQMTSDARSAQELIQAGFFAAMEMARGNVSLVNDKAQQDVIRDRLEESLDEFVKANQGKVK